MAGAEDRGGNMVILTSVGASVGVLLVVAATLTVVLCVWQRSRKSKCYLLKHCIKQGIYFNGRLKIQYMCSPAVSQSAPENPTQYAICTAENEAYVTHIQQQQGGQQIDSVLCSALIV